MRSRIWRIMFMTKEEFWNSSLVDLKAKIALIALFKFTDLLRLKNQEYWQKQLLQVKETTWLNFCENFKNSPSKRINPLLEPWLLVKLDTFLSLQFHHATWTWFNSTRKNSSSQRKHKPALRFIHNNFHHTWLLKYMERLHSMREKEH